MTPPPPRARRGRGRRPPALFGAASLAAAALAGVCCSSSSSRAAAFVPAARSGRGQAGGKNGCHHARLFSSSSSPSVATESGDIIGGGTATPPTSLTDPESVVVTVPPESVETISTEDVPPPRFEVESNSDEPDDNNVEAAAGEGQDNKKGKKTGGRPAWMKCINAVTPRTMPLNEAVSNVCIDAGEEISLEAANDLIGIGAVWARMDLLNEDDIMEQYYTTSGGGGGSDDGLGGLGGNVGTDAWSVDGSGKVQYADMPKGWMGSDHRYTKFLAEEEDLEEYVDRMKKQRYRRVTSPVVLEAGTDLRVYPHPRRFPACYDLAGEGRLLYEDTTFIVVDKPPLLPTQPDASNYKECCPGCVNDLLGPFTTVDGRPVRRPLLCHRVDSVVGGCVVLSKDGHGQKVFSQLQRERKLKKLYLTLTTEPVPLGRHVHWMWAPANERGQMGGPPCQFVSHAPPASRRKARESWIRCVLEVVRCEEIEVDEEADGHGYVPDSNDDGGTRTHYQTTIRLVTGRKHQVRAQLSSLGAPIVRDTLYGPIAGLTLDGLENDEESEMAMDDAVAKVRIPTEPIGLQAHAILFGGVRARAGRPWWGDRVAGSKGGAEEDGGNE